MIEELKLAQLYPDYTDVIKKHLPEVLKSDPDLRDAISSAPNPYKMAYVLAKRSDSYMKEMRDKTRSPEVQQAVQNLSKPGNLSSVSHGVSGSAPRPYKDMNDSDFMALANRNLGYA